MPIPGLENPTLSELCQVVIDTCMAELRVALPGVVKSYNASKREAEVQPLLMRRGIDEPAATKLPVLPRVPIVFPQTNAGALILPIASGDPVTLLFSDRALDAWRSSSGTVEVADSIRMHDLSDCWAFPGGWPGAKSFTPAADGALALQVKPGTGIYLGNGQSGVEVLELLNEFMDIFALATGLMVTYSTHIHTNNGADPPTDTAAWVAAQVKLLAFQTKLKTLLS